MRAPRLMTSLCRQPPAKQYDTVAAYPTGLASSPWGSRKVWTAGSERVHQGTLVPRSVRSIARGCHLWLTRLSFSLDSGHLCASNAPLAPKAAECPGHTRLTDVDNCTQHHRNSSRNKSAHQRTMYGPSPWNLCDNAALGCVNFLKYLHQAQGKRYVLWYRRIVAVRMCQDQDVNHVVVSVRP